MFKLIIFLVAGVFIYRLFGGKIPIIDKSTDEKKIEEDTLVECETCSTYVTQKESIVIRGKYYCSKECSKK